MKKRGFTMPLFAQKVKYHLAGNLLRENEKRPRKRAVFDLLTESKKRKLKNYQSSSSAKPTHCPIMGEVTPSNIITAKYP